MSGVCRVCRKDLVRHGIGDLRLCKSLYDRRMTSAEDDLRELAERQRLESALAAETREEKP